MKILENDDDLAALTQAKRILVLGCCGSGKTILAKKLAARLNLPLVTLDDAYWGPAWMRPDDQEWRSRLARIVGQPTWIVDGNYLPTVAIRLEQANLAIVYDLPTAVCLWSTILRDFKRLLADRRDLPQSIQTQGGSGFGRLWLFVLRFRLRVRPHLLEALAPWGGYVLFLRSRREAGCLIDRLEHAGSLATTA